MSSSVRDLNRTINNLLAKFSFVDGNPLSVLFDSICMSIYRSQLFSYMIKIVLIVYMSYGET